MFIFGGFIALQVLYCYISSYLSLQDAPEFDIGPDLESALKKSPGGSIPYACINGAASVSDQPIKSNYTAADEGIIQHILLQEHRTKRTQGYW